MITFNALDKKYKSITGSAEAGKKIKMSVDADENVQNVFLCFRQDGLDAQWKLHLSLKKIIKNKKRFSVEFSLPKEGLYFYYFEFSTADGKFFAAGRGEGQAAQTGSGTEFQLSAYRKSPVSQKYRGGIMYHIFADRFCRSGSAGKFPKNAVLKKWGEVPEYRPQNGKVLNNDFFGGNFKGIISKLDYLKSLNVSMIYLSPIFKAVSNHKYDTADFMSIDEGFGTEKEFKNLVAEAEGRGIGVVLDGVFSHTGDDSIYFNKYGNYPDAGAYHGKESPYYDWFSFTNPPEKYESWWGIETLPQINKNSLSYRNFICGQNGVLEKWFGCGINGLRLDVVDELPDVFLNELCSKVKEFGKENIIIGEVWEDASNKISYGKRRNYLNGGQLDSVMNYPLKDALINFVLSGESGNLAETIKQQINNYPKLVLDNLMNILSTHDTKRILTAVSGVDLKSKDEQAEFKLNPPQRKDALKKVMLCTVLQYCLYGFPSVFYGDEAGVEGFADPFCRTCFPWGNEDKKLLNFYEKLGKLRSNEVFVKSDVKNIKNDGGLISFERKTKTQKLVIAVNAGQTDAMFDFPKGTVDFFDKRPLGKQYCIIPMEFAVAVIDTL